jgi:hypothetical protein
MIDTRNMIDRLFYSSVGQLIISSLFGLSLALLFNRVCKENCVLYFAPKYDDIDNKIFKLEDTDMDHIVGYKRHNFIRQAIWNIISIRFDGFSTE